MKKVFFLAGVVALAGCASNVQHPALTVESVADNRTATVTPKDAAIFSDIPLKPMTASQSAAKMN